MQQQQLMIQQQLLGFIQHAADRASAALASAAAAARSPLARVRLDDQRTTVRCVLESARGFLRARPGLYVYRAGRALDDGELSPACMSDAFRCLGKAARAALCAIARNRRR
ncbi:uncharacterized protein [Miscanthus floridulus]|uniref:uncharacterized protein n=1 Tax=Miscanthus floridulus TaxID=154761 RepID=UPI003459BA15